MEQVIREWLELAEMDYGVAMHLIEFWIGENLFFRGKKHDPISRKLAQKL